MRERDKWLGTFKCYMLSGAIALVYGILSLIIAGWLGLNLRSPEILWPAIIAAVVTSIGVLPWKKYE